MCKFNELPSTYIDNMIWKKKPIYKKNKKNKK